MKIDLSQEITDLNGSVLTTLKDVAMKSLLGGCVGDEKSTVDDKVKRFELGLKIKLEAKDGIVELESEDVTLIKICVGGSIAGYTPLVVGQVVRLIEGKKVMSGK